jgi:hypothetical protein
MAKTKETKIYQIKIMLSQTEIWRTFLVKSDIKLSELHLIIQTIMGWSNSHMHQFFDNGIIYGMPNVEDYGLDIVDYRKIKLDSIINKTGKYLTYDYDFGDGWEHVLMLEKILPVEEKRFYPVCLDGEKDVPPEDCGGIPGYEEILIALKDKKKAKYKELLEWVGNYDPEYFNIEQINEFLKEKDYGCFSMY